MFYNSLYPIIRSISIGFIDISTNFNINEIIKKFLSSLHTVISRHFFFILTIHSNMRKRKDNVRLNTKIDDSFPFISHSLSISLALRSSGQNVFALFLHSFFLCLRRGPLISFSYSLLLPNSKSCDEFYNNLSSLPFSPPPPSSLFSPCLLLYILFVQSFIL